MSITASTTHVPTVSNDCHGFITGLVLRCGEGDENALAKLFDLTFFLVSAVVCRGKEASPGIDDLVVAAFVRIWRHSPTYEPAQRGALAWIFDQAVADGS
jgi:DNA-directed RNA polymerase specialized sigma24 family protein